MKDYSNLGLNSYLRKAGGIASSIIPFQDAYRFDAFSEIGLITSTKLANSIISADQIQSNAVTDAKISGMSWSKGSEGTASFGGSANENGIIQVEDSSGAAIWQNTRFGVQKSWGSIEAQSTAAATTAGTTPTAIVGGTASINTSVDSLGLLYCLVDGNNNAGVSGTFSGSVIVYDGTTEISLLTKQIIGNFAATATNQDEHLAMAIPYEVTSGSHDFNLQFQANGGGTLTFNNWTLGCLVLDGIL